MAHKKRHAPVGIVAAAALLTANPAFAQAAADGTDTAQDAATAELIERTARLEARAELIEQRTEVITQQNALLQALGVPETSGTTTLEDTAGQIEGAIMAAWAINAAAQGIAKEVESKQGTRSVIVLTGDTAFRLSDNDLFTLATERLISSSQDLLASACPDSGAADPGAAFVGPGALTALTTVLGLLRTDTTISGYSIDNLDSTLAAAVAGRMANARMIGEMIAMDPANAALKSYDSLADVQQQLRNAQTRGTAAGSCPGGADAKVLDKAGIATVNAAMAANDGFMGEALKRPASGGLSPLERAAAAAGFHGETPANPPLILRMAVVEAGGSVIERGNLWTTLGASAIGLTGGLVAHFTLIDPADQSVKAGGIVACGTDKASFDKVHSGKPEAHCYINGTLVK